MNRREIFDAIQSERDYQDNRWGTDFDDENTVNDWGTYVNQYVARATKMGATTDEQKQALVKVAAIAVAALETIGRNGKLALRHYDDNNQE